MNEVNAYVLRGLVNDILDIAESKRDYETKSQMIWFQIIDNLALEVTDKREGKQCLQ